MTPDRFKRTKSVVVSSAIALVVAAATFGVSSVVFGPKSSGQHPGFDLTSNSSSFTITSAIYASPTCSGTPALLYPGTTRCAVFSVHNTLNVPITVQSITSAIDTSFLAPPANCAPPTYFTLPSFSGSATVLAGATTALPGVPIKLLDNGNQDNCENFQYHFTYSGTALYTDSTSTVLTSTPNPSTLGQSVTFTATVTGGNPSTDANPPGGNVTFYKCTSATVCPNSAGNLLGTGTIGTGGKATYSTSTLPIGTTYVDAVYPASGTDFTGSTSNVVSQVVTTIGTSTVLTSTPNPSALGSSVTFTATVTPTSGTPTGTVNFYKCTSATVCPNTGTPLGTGTIGTGNKATFSISSLPQGDTFVDAVYAGSASFTSSTSNVVTQDVQAGTTTVLTSAPNPSVSGSSVTFTATVTAGSGTPTGMVTFYKGTPTTGTALGAPVNLIPSTGKATLSYSALPLGTDPVYAVYSGDTNFSGSTSPVLDQIVLTTGCINNTVNGGYTVKSGQFICITGRVNGGVTVEAGGSLFLNGATINGGVISTAGANTLRFCGSTINGNDNIQNSTGFVLVGDGGDVAPNGDDLPPACAGNTFNTVATLTFVNNHGGLEIGGNTVVGILNITGNTSSSPQEVEANKITGTLTCGATNNPALTDDGLKNTVVGIRAGQCAGANF